MSDAGKTVLVVEDHRGTRELLARSLRARGYHCHLAGNGEEAIELLSTTGVDLALLDIVMPTTTGLTLFKYMKDNHPEVAVIFVTALDDLQLVAEYFKQGAYDYIVKSTVKHRLTSSVEEALERRQVKLKDKRHLGHLEELVEHQRTALQDRWREISALNRMLCIWLDRESGLEPDGDGLVVGGFAGLTPNAAPEESE